MNDFNPFAKELELKRESTSWDTSGVVDAEPGDIPVLDLEEYFATRSASALEQVADQLRIACEETGFFSIIGHDVPAELVKTMFSQVRSFHELPLKEKNEIRIDRPGWPHGGMGYLPVKNQKLPARDKVNFNEAFLIKADENIALDHNQWPSAQALPDFRSTVTDYSEALTDLGKRLLPIYARALSVPADYFEEAFDIPTWRLRMSHYPSARHLPDDEFGINPHVDTTFCTILAQDSPGLAIYSERRQAWIRVPVVKDGFVVNTGELLRQWTNDRFISVKHFANNNTGEQSRYSIPFFFNANASYVMHCVPGCSDDDNPPKYPPVSYAGSQAIAQGE